MFYAELEVLREMLGAQVKGGQDWEWAWGFGITRSSLRENLNSPSDSSNKTDLISLANLIILNLCPNVHHSVFMLIIPHTKVVAKLRK